MRLVINLNRDLATELATMSKDVHLQPAQFATEALESAIASRRLERRTDPNLVTSPRMPAPEPEAL